MASYDASRLGSPALLVGSGCTTGGSVKRLVAVCLVAAALPGSAAAQLTPGNHSFVALGGAYLPRSELLRTTAVMSTPRPTDPTNPVVTDIKLDPGLFLGGRYVYALNRRLAIEAEFDFALSICAIRQLEVMPTTEEGDEPQYETTTMDAHTYQMTANLVYFMGNWTRAHPFLTIGVGNHILNLRQKGQVDPDPVYDPTFMAGIGTILHANERLGIRIEVRDFMYNFRFDNQFVDPVQSQYIIYRRPDFYNATSVSRDKFQNDIAVTVGFMVHPF